MLEKIYCEYLKHRLQIFPLCDHGARNNSIVHDTTIKLIGILTTIFGSILNPLVSSSKNLIRPPLDAGSGADFLLLLLMVNSQDPDFDIKTLLVGVNLP